MIKNSRKAFSIAEVLVTMMVVSLIVIMSAPVITRKKLIPMLNIRAVLGPVLLMQTGKP